MYARGFTNALRPTGSALLGVLAVLVLLVMLLGGAVLWQSHRLSKIKSELQHSEALRAAQSDEHAEAIRMYTQALQNLSESLSEARRRITAYESAVRDSKPAPEWSKQEIPKEVRDALNYN